MDLYKNIENDRNAALKKGDAVRLSVLRMLLSEVKILEIEKKVKTLEEKDIIQIIRRQIKQHKESIGQFEKGGRKDLVDKEAEELKILESYMPEQMNEDQLLAIIKEAISKTGAATKSDGGKVINAVMDKVAGKADGKTVNQLVMKLLK